MVQNVKYLKCEVRSPLSLERLASIKQYAHISKLSVSVANNHESDSGNVQQCCQGTHKDSVSCKESPVPSIWLRDLRLNDWLGVPVFVGRHKFIENELDMPCTLRMKVWRILRKFDKLKTHSTCTGLAVWGACFAWSGLLEPLWRKLSEQMLDVSRV